MSQLSSIAASMYSDLSVNMPDVAHTAEELAAMDKDALLNLFATETYTTSTITPGSSDEFVRIINVREFPAMGTPPNVVNVPNYGSSTSQQIQGQADAPSMEISLNYVAAEWAEDTLLGEMVGDGQQYVFRFTLLNAKPDGYQSDSVGGSIGLGTVENSIYFWVGKAEAKQVTPQLTDASTMTLTLTMQSEFKGSYTVDGA